MDSKMKNILIALVVSASFCGVADQSETALKIPSSVISGSGSYTVDILNPSYWSAGLPTSSSTVTIQLDEGSKTPFVISSGEVNLEHFKVESKDFYLRSDYPLIFNSETSSVVTCSSSYGLKIEAPAIFNADVIYNSSASLRWLKPFTAYGDFDLTENSGRKVLTVVGARGSEVKGVLKGTYNSASSANPPGISVVASSCQIANMAQVSFNDVSSFGGSYWLKYGNIKLSCASNNDDVTPALPSSGMVLHFDASDDSTFTFEKGGLVKEWRDKVSGRKLYPAIDGRYPIRRANALGALPVVDFLGHTLYSKQSGAPLRFSTDEIVKTAKSAFWVIGSQKGGGWIFGSETGSRIFHRGGSSSQGDYPGAPLSNAAYAGNIDARFYKNGKLFDGTKEGLSGNWDVLSVVDSTAFSRGICGFAFDNLTNVTGSRSGYMELAEFVAYDTELDDASRKQVEEYLKRKWLNGREDLQHVVVVDMGGISTVASGDGNSEKHLNNLFMRGELVKDGDGTLVLDKPRDIESAVIVKDGTLKIENNDNAKFFSGMEVSAPSSEGLIFHLDASNESSIEVEDGYVKEWKSLVGDNGLTPRPSAQKAFVSKTWDGKKIVDFGHFKSKRAMDLVTRITNAKTVIMTFNARNGGGHLLGDTSAGGGTSFHRGGSVDDHNYTPYDVGSPIFNMSSSLNLESWIDGEIVSAWKMPPPSGRFTTCAFKRLDNNDLTIGTIGCDRGNLDARSGGLQVAELLVYSRHLTQVEIVEATAYLNQKWKNANKPTLAGVDVKGEDTVFEVTCDTSLGVISGDGAITATGSGTVKVEGFERGWSGALSSAAGAWNIRHDKGAAPSEPVKTGLIGWYDPSDKETITINDNGEVTELKSKVEGASSFKQESLVNLPNAFSSAEVGGRTLVDCGDRYANKGLILDADLSNAMSVIMVYDASNGGGHLFGVRKEQQAFQRNINHPDMPIFDEVSAGNTVLKYANVWVDGVPRGKGASGMKAGCQIISFTAPGPFYLGSIGIRELTSTKAAGGGQRYGEILIYDHVLTDEERSSTEAYLAAKWWGEPMAGYTVDGKPNMPGQQSDSSVALTVPSEETLSVGYLAGEGGVVKTGSGTLELMGSTSELSGDIDVREGTVKYTVRTLDVDTLPVTGGLLAHFDAADESSFIKNANGGVIGWKAKAAAAKYGELVAESYFKDSSGNPRAGTYLANELNGRGVLDCGAHGNSGVGFVFPETISNVNHVVMLFGSQNGGGFILGEINDGVSNEIWHREWPYNDISCAIFNSDGRGLNLYVEGIKKEKVTEKNVLNGGYQILEVSLDTWSANKSVSGFGLDRVTFPERAGGQRYAEVMIYDHVLSAEERLALLIYLNNRWRNANYVGSGVFDAMYLDRANAGRVTVADGATFDLNGFTQTTEMLGGSGTIKGGNVIVTDEVLASFGDDALSVEGTLTFSGAGAIVFPADWTGGYGRWKLFSATKIEGNVRDWVGTGIVNGKEYNAKLSVSGNTVYLNINSPGTEIIIR